MTLLGWRRQFFNNLDLDSHEKWQELGRMSRPALSDRLAQHHERMNNLGANSRLTADCSLEISSRRAPGASPHPPGAPCDAREGHKWHTRCRSSPVSRSHRHRSHRTNWTPTWAFRCACRVRARKGLARIAAEREGEIWGNLKANLFLGHPKLSD